MLRIINGWLNSQSFLRTGIELGWLPRKIGIRMERSSSIKRPPQLMLHLLRVKSKCSGTSFNGRSKTSLTFAYYEFVESLRRASMTSGWLQTSISSGEAQTFRVMSIIGGIFRVLYAKIKVLSSLEVQQRIAFLIKLSCSDGELHTPSRIRLTGT